MAFALVGVTVYSIINAVFGFVVFAAAMGASTDGDSGSWIVAAGAVLLALAGLRAGAGLLFVRRPWATGSGLGLMLGWALWSIVTAGWCTGLNPALYG